MPTVLVLKSPSANHLKAVAGTTFILEAGLLCVSNNTGGRHTSVATQHVMRLPGCLASAFPQCHWPHRSRGGLGSRIIGSFPTARTCKRRRWGLIECPAAEGPAMAGTVGQAPFTFRGTVFDELGLDNVQVTPHPPLDALALARLHGLD